jgi:hypothetical protein
MTLSLFLGERDLHVLNFLVTRGGKTMRVDFAGSLRTNFDLQRLLADPEFLANAGKPLVELGNYEIGDDDFRDVANYVAKNRVEAQEAVRDAVLEIVAGITARKAHPELLQRMAGDVEPEVLNEVAGWLDRRELYLLSLPLVQGWVSETEGARR